MTMMMTLLNRGQRPACPHCDTATQIRKHGKARSGLPRYMCLSCRGTFQGRYIYPAYQTDGNDRVGS
ncbi:transposase [Budvicia aquatica]|uniref:transposase n=1 Tax=Budvicia aquatica TaxID=82979 RepID=UPI003F65B4BD